MATSRKGPSLFEVIRKRDPSADSGRVEVPKWWTTRQKRDTPESPEADAATSDAANVDRSSIAATRSRLITIDGPRLVISLSSVYAGIAVALLIALSSGVYVLGHASGRATGQEEGYARARRAIESATLNEIDAARLAKPNPGIFAGLPSSPTRPPKVGPTHRDTAKPKTARPTSSATPRWIKGYTYIVVQEFRANDRAEMQKARSFLRDNGIPTVVVEASGKSRYKYRLVTQKGFNRGDPLQKRRCDEYHQRIRKLGKAFVKSGGRYDLQGYQKKATSDRG